MDRCLSPMQMRADMPPQQTSACSDSLLKHRCQSISRASRHGKLAFACTRWGDTKLPSMCRGSWGMASMMSELLLFSSVSSGCDKTYFSSRAAIRLSLP